MNPEDPLQQMAERFSAMVDRRLLEIVRREKAVENLHDGLLYALGLDLEDPRERGKRLRPILCLATTEALAGKVEHALNFACAIELMHNFALVHDDIEDGDEVRRNRPCVWRHYGLAHGINIGDYLLCKVWAVLLEDNGLDAATRLRLLALMSETLDHTHVGQCLDINARHNRAFTHDEYFRLAREKTSYYLAAPIVGGAIVAGASPEICDALNEFGHLLGPLFQITDDVLDLSRGKGRGGQTGSDIREGKRSYLIAEVTARASGEEREALYDILDKPRAETTDKDVERVIQLFEKYGVIAQAQKFCDTLLEKSLALLRTVPAPLEGVLSLVARQVAERKR